VTLLGPAALCRLDDALLGRVRRGERVGALLASCGLTIALGASAYGVALGVWRGPLQALFSAVKLPLLLLAVAALTVGLGAMLAALFRARLSLGQTGVCVLLSLAVTSAVLGAAAPISLFFSANAPPPDPTIVGLPIADPRVQPSLSVARGLTLLHVAVVALAGMAGVIRLRGLLARLGLAPHVARRTLVSWMAAQLLCGTQLSWLMRPFFGRPHLPETISCDDLLKSHFFEEIAVCARAAFGPFAGVVGLVAALVILGILAEALRARPERVRITVGPRGLVVTRGEGRGAPEEVPWSAIHAVHARGAEVRLELRADAAFVRDELAADTPSDEASHALAAAIERERTRARGGPFRTSGERGPDTNAPD